MENLREERWDFASINNVNRTYKTGGYEQARNANFRQMTKTFQRNSFFWTKIFLRMNVFFVNLNINL
jgi:hypothetical protein